MDQAEQVRSAGILLIRMALGDLDEAFRVLNKQAVRHAWDSSVNFDPIYEELRKVPRFPEFCLTVALPS